MGIRLALIIATTAFGYASTSAGVEVTTLEPQGGVGIERGVVAVRCSTGSPNVWRTSRGAVLDLDLGDTDHDVILTTTHGLSVGLDATQRHCRILGARGRSYGIEGVWRATGDETGRTRDWSVLLVRRRLEGNVGRLRIGQVTAEGMLRLTAESAPVRLVLSNADGRQGDCNLRSVENGAVGALLTGLMFYSCHTFPGLSGSPILARIDGRPLLIGIHVGWGLVGVNGGQVRSVNVGHAIDEEIAVAIAAAVAQARD